MGLENYEVNGNTMALIPMGEKKTRVIESDREFVIPMTTMEIIDHSCRFFGSSYLGRYEGTKSLLGFNYKLPIIIEEMREIVFFPTASPQVLGCEWISLQYIDKYEKRQTGSSITFKTGKKIPLSLSFYTLENQIMRATRLLMILNQRKQQK